MRRALAHRAYRRLFLSQIVALTGTGLATVALGLLAHDLAGPDAGQVLGTAFAIKMVAYVVVAPIASAVVVRLPRRAVMIASDVLRMVVALSLPFVGEIWQVYLLIFVLQAASATFTPTFQSVIPEMLPDEDDYTAALSLSRLAYDLEAVAAPMLAALLLLLLPSSALFFGTAVGFAGSTVLVASVAVPRPVEGRADAHEPPFAERVRRGGRLFLRTTALRPILALNLAVAAAGAFVLVQTVVIARSAFGHGDGTVAVLLAVHGAGSITAAMTVPAVLRTVPERRVMMAGATLLTTATAAVPLALGSESPTVGLVGTAVLWAVIGAAWAVVDTPVGRIIRRHVAVGDLPAAFAAQFSLSHACWLVTYPLAGVLGTAGLSRAALVLAGIAAAATVAAGVLWSSTGDHRHASASVPSAEVP